MERFLAFVGSVTTGLVACVSAALLGAYASYLLGIDRAAGLGFWAHLARVATSIFGAP